MIGYKTYDSWKTTNPEDEWLGPHPDERDQEPEPDEDMTPTQYKAAIKSLGLSQERAGEWLGIAPRTSQGYALGEYPVPEAIAKLLRLMIRFKLTPKDV